MKAVELIGMCEATRKLRKERIGTNIHVTDVETGEEVLVFDTTKLKPTYLPRSLDALHIGPYDFVTDEKPKKEEPTKDLPVYVVKSSHATGILMYIAWPKTGKSFINGKFHSESNPEFAANGRNMLIAQMNNVLGKDKYKVIA